MTLPSLWDAAEFGALPVDPESLAVDIAQGLGHGGSAVVEVIRLHLEAIDSALSLGVAELLADQLRWQQVRLRAAGLDLDATAVDRAVLAALDPLLDEMGRARVIDVHNTAYALGDAGMVADNAIELSPGPARDYLEMTLNCDRDGAVAIIRQALLAGEDPADVMLGVLQPAQVELGRLWEAGEISIAHEHYTTAVTQLCLGLLYPRMLADRTLLGRTMVAAGVDAEAHEIGLRMISDLFERAGWRTAYLGSSVPSHVIIEQVAAHRADVLALSATMSGHIVHVRRLISQVRVHPGCAGVKILVGGRPFTINPRLVELVGADGWAADATGALELCTQWAETGAGAPD